MVQRLNTLIRRRIASHHARRLALLIAVATCALLLLLSIPIRASRKAVLVNHHRDEIEASVALYGNAISTLLDQATGDQDITALLQAALPDGETGMFWLAVLDENDALVFGSTQLLTTNPVVNPVTLPDGRVWQIAIAPLEGWASVVNPELSQEQSIGLVIIFLLSVLVYLIAVRQLRLQTIGKAHSREINAVYQQIKAGDALREQMANALQESQARFQGAFESARMGIALLDVEGRFFQVNPMICEILGYDAEELLSLGVQDILHVDEREIFLRILKDVLTERKPYAEFEQRCHYKNGQLIWGKLALSLVRDAQNEPLYFVLHFDDRTEQKRMEEVLWNQIVRTELILQSSTDGFCTIEQDGRIQEANEAFTLITGYQQTELVGMTIGDLEPPPGGHFLELVASTQETNGSHAEIAILHRDGSERMLSVSLTLIDIGESCFYFLSAQDITERKQSELALRQSEQKSRGIVDNSQDGIRLIDEEGRIIEWNESAARITGLSYDDVIGRFLWEVQHSLLPESQRTPENLKIARGLTQRMLKTGEVIAVDLSSRIQRPDGDIRVIASSLFAVETSKGYMIGSIFRDITEQEHAEVEMRKLSRAVFQNPASIVITDTNGVIEFINPKFTEVSGYSLEEARGQKPSILKSGLTPPEVYTKLWETIEAGGEWRGELYNRRKDGTYYWEFASISAIKDAEGNTTHYLGIKEDITERKMAEQALRESEDRFRSLTESSLAGIMIIQDGRFQYVNPAFARIFGYEVEEIVGCDGANLVHPDDWDIFRREVMSSTVWDGSSLYQPFRGRRKDGTTIYCEVLSSRIEYQGGTAVMGTLLDITERRLAEQALKESQRTLTTLMDNLPGMAYRCRNDEHWTMEFVSEGVTELTGYDPIDLLENNTVSFAELIHPDDRERVYRSVQAAVKVGKSFRLQFRIFTRDGQERWVWEQGREIVVSTGHTVLEGFVTDITERMLAEIALYTSEQRYRTLYTTMSEGVVLHEMVYDEAGKPVDYRLLDVNNAYETITGYKREDVIGRLATEIYQVDTPRHLETYVQVVETREPVKMEYFFEPAQKHLSMSVFAMEGAQFATVFSDITARKRSEDALRESESKLRAVTEAAADGILSIGQSGEIISWNKGAEQIFGFAAEEILGHSLWRLIPALSPNGHSSIEQLVGATSAPFAGRAVQLRGVRKDGSEFPLELTLGSWHIGKEVFYSGIIRDITERKRAEQALREAQLELRQIIDLVPHMISVKDKDGRFVLVNQAVAHAYGTTVEALTGKHEADFNPIPEQIAAFRQTDLQTIQLGGTLIIPEHEFQNAAGEVRYLQTIKMPYYGANLDDTGVLAVSVDITDLKRAQAAEHEQRSMAEALRDTAAALVSSLDPDIVLSYILDNLERVVPHEAANIALIEGNVIKIVNWRGYEPEVAQAIESLVFPLDTPNYRQMYETGLPCLISDTTSPDAAHTWQNWEATTWVKSYASAPIRTHGQVVGFINLDSNVPGYFTEAHLERLQAFADQAAIAIENAQLYDQIRRHANVLEQWVVARTAELESERAQLQAILDSMGEGVVYTENMNARYVNRRLIEMVGFSADMLVNRMPELIMSHIEFPDYIEADRQAYFSRLLQEQQIWRGEVKIKRQDGSLFDASLTVTLVSTHADEPICTVTLIRDISQEKQLEDQRVRFIANASHELRTPIANMKTRLYLLRKQPEKYGEHMNVLEFVTERMERLIEELLDISRFERGVIQLNQEMVTLQSLIFDVVSIQQPAAEQKRITLTHELPSTPLRAYVDSSRIARVITNLVTNAINYTPEDGHVTVELAREGDSALIHIRDTGIGIAPDTLEKIFEPFYRVSERAAPGTGLGLTISREIIALHHGDLFVESEVGHGSTFTIRLKLAGTGKLHS